MQTPRFIHLNCHSEFSLIDSTIRLSDFLDSCIEQKMPAIALTDKQNMFAFVKFYKKAMAMGIKPLIGTDILMDNPDDPQHPFRAILLCKNKAGYQSLTRLISRAYLEGQASGEPLVERKWLAEHSNGLIMLSGAQFGDVGQALCAGKFQRAEKLARRWNEVFPDSYYIELQRVERENEEFYINNALQVADKNDIPVVATNAVRFLTEDDFTSHEARVAINQGYTLADKRRPKNYTPKQYFRSEEDMCELFTDIPEALENTVEIAKRCNLTITLGEVFLPDFPVPEGMTIEDYLENVSKEGLSERLQVVKSDFTQSEYDQRLTTELSVINEMGFAGYFLIVADFIQWSKENDVPVGPGRGSGAGSLVAYVLGITDLDPIEHGLLFERFLNPERVSMPDFDIDFCMRGRDRVIDYVSDKYGESAVSQIITYGTMAAKAVVRDVGRVLGHPYGFVDSLAKMIPFELGITLTKALQQEEALAERYQREDEVRALFDLAMRLEGLTRNVGKHAGGVVIAPSALTDYTPVYTESQDGSMVSQFDKDDVEAVGLVKFDFLGLRTLTIIDWAVKAINQRLNENQEDEIDISTIDLTDESTFSLLKACNTTAVFQLESRGMKDLIKRLQPDCFEDIVALVALFRPGPLQSGMVDDFINRKHGREKVEYPHPALSDILRETYGTILYQEQVMQIAQKLAGYSLGGADILRRAMGKKKPEEMAKQREIFEKGAAKNGVDIGVASSIFDLMEKFAAYGFNKSHSAAYALISYQTAWLKTHYPSEFMAAVLSSDMDNTDKLVVFYEDAKEQNISILPPDINKSECQFVANDTGEILYGLAAIKGVGEAALESIIDNRKQEGSFQDLFDFCQRIDLRKANRRVLEALIKSGALDGFGQERSVLLASLEKAQKSAEQAARNKDRGQADLFGGVSSSVTPAEYVNVSAWSEKERLDAEKESLGLFLSGHPLDRYQHELKQLVSCKIRDFDLSRERTLKIAGYITAMRTVNTKKGARMAIITLDDGSGRTDIAIFPKLYQEYQEILQKDAIIVVEGDAQMDRFTGSYRFNTNTILTLDQARASFSRGIVVSLQQNKMASSTLKTLKGVLTSHKGGKCAVFVDYENEEATARLNLGDDWRVQPADELLDGLKKVVGDSKVTILYS